MTAIHLHLPLPAVPGGRAWASADDERPRRGRGRGRGHRGGPDRERGFGPGFPGPGGFGPGFGPGPGRRRAARGNVRNAVLALLAEEPLHGYAIIGLLAERSGGLWRPSPGSVYPVLTQLESDGLVSADESSGRKVFSLTDAGRAYVDEHAAELHEPWSVAQSRHRDRAAALFHTMRGLGAAVHEVARHGHETQVEAAATVLDDARRAIYAILAEKPTPTSDGAPDGPSDEAPHEQQ
jgi:DNA-binding PadR family transcriptional regulator